MIRFPLFFAGMLYHVVLPVSPTGFHVTEPMADSVAVASKKHPWPRPELSCGVHQKVAFGAAAARKNGKHGPNKHLE